MARFRTFRRPSRRRRRPFRWVARCFLSFLSPARNDATVLARHAPERTLGFVAPPGRPTVFFQQTEAKLVPGLFIAGSIDSTVVPQLVRFNAIGQNAFNGAGGGDTLSVSRTAVVTLDSSQGFTSLSLRDTARVIPKRGGNKVLRIAGLPPERKWNRPLRRRPRRHRHRPRQRRRHLCPHGHPGPL